MFCTDWSGSELKPDLFSVKNKHKRKKKLEINDKDY